MIIFYLILLAAFIPFMGFLLAKESTHKTIVFSFSFIVLGISLFGFVSKFSFLGSAQEQILANQLEDAIYDDARLQEIFLIIYKNFLMKIHRLDGLKRVFFMRSTTIVCKQQSSLWSLGCRFLTN